MGGSASRHDGGSLGQSSAWGTPSPTRHTAKATTSRSSSTPAPASQASSSHASCGSTHQQHHQHPHGARRHPRACISSPLPTSFLLAWALLLLLGLSARAVHGAETADAPTAAEAAVPVQDPAGKVELRAGPGSVLSGVVGPLDLLLARPWWQSQFGVAGQAGQAGGSSGSSSSGSGSGGSEGKQGNSKNDSLRDADAEANRTAGYYRQLPHNSPVVGALLVALPGSSSYLMVQRPTGSSSNAATLINAAIMDVDTGEATAFQPPRNYFCGGAVILASGDPLLVGGDKRFGPIQDGRKTLTVFNRTSRTFHEVNKLQWNRWYGTPQRMGDTRVLVSGGTSESDGGTIPPVAEVWDAADPSAPTQQLQQPQRFVEAAGKNWFPSLQLLPRGDMLWWGDHAGSITSGRNGTLLADLPPLPSNITYATMYPYTGTPTLLALRHEDGYAPSFMVFGGGSAMEKPNSKESYTVSAPSTSLRLDLTHCGTALDSGYCAAAPGWRVEDMLGLGRVMGDSVVLPNGKVLVLGGAQAGLAAYAPLVNSTYRTGRATRPNTVSLLYDPYAPAGRRYEPLSPTPIIRLYHSTSCLHHTGEVLVAGCDVCDEYGEYPPGVSPNPDGTKEHRLQLVVPGDIGPGVQRPVIVAHYNSIRRGGQFSVVYEYDGELAGASLAAPCTCTHSLNMNQRVITLELVRTREVRPTDQLAARAGDGSGGDQGRRRMAILLAPPEELPALAPLGHYLLFLVGPDRSYSRGAWVQLVA